MRMYSVWEVQVLVQLRKSVNAKERVYLLTYHVPLLVIFYRLGKKSSTRKPSSIGILEATVTDIKLTPYLSYHSYMTLSYT